MGNLSVPENPVSATAVPQGRRAFASDVDSGGLAVVASKIDAVGKQVVAAQARIDNRNDLIDRVGLVNEYEAALSTEASRLGTEGDITKQSTLTDYGIFAKDQAKGILERHGGSDDSMGRLIVDLEEKRAAAAGGLGKASVKAGLDLVNQSVSTGLGAVTVEAGQTGDVDAAFLAGDAWVDKHASGLGVGQEQDHKIAHRAATLTEVFETRLAARDLESAEMLLSRPDITQYMDAAAIRKLRTKLTVDQTAEQKGIAKAEKDLAEVVAINGGPLSAEQEAAYKKSKLDFTKGADLGTKISEFEAAMQIAKKDPSFRASPQQIEKMQGAFVADDSAFGNRLRGKSLSIVDDGLVGFTNELLHPDKEQSFRLAVFELSKPVEVFDPILKQTVLRQVPLSPLIQKAYAKRGIPLPNQGAVDQPAPSAEGLNTLTPAEPAAGSTLFDLTLTSSGVFAGGKAALGGVPVVGDISRTLAPDTAKITQARSELAAVGTSLTETLARNKRAPAELQKELAAKLDLTAKTFTTQGAAIDNLVGIDNTLVKLAQNAATTLSLPPGQLTPEDHKEALSTLAAVSNFRRQLGLPPQIKTDKEYNDLAPGELYIHPEGDLRKKSGEAATAGP